MQYIQKRRTITHEELLSRGLFLEGLLPPDMSSIQEKLAGYQFNEFQYWEINNVHDMQLVKALVDRRICQKNFKTETFEDYANEYDVFFRERLQQWISRDDSEVFDFLSMFTLEWKYSFDFYYELATEMVMCNVSEIPDVARRLSAFCGTPTINSLLSKYAPHLLRGTVCTDSRMLVSRRKYIHDIVLACKEEFEDELNRFAESLAIVAVMLTRMTYRKTPIREWFLRNSSVKDWLSVFRQYNVFRAFVSEKEWNNRKKIRYVKELYSQSSYDYKNPGFRS